MWTEQWTTPLRWYNRWKLHCDIHFVVFQVKHLAASKQVQIVYNSSLGSFSLGHDFTYCSFTMFL